MDDRLFQPLSEGAGLFKDRGSKFLSFAHPIRDQQDIAVRLADIKKSYHDARHHCYAWRLGVHGDQSLANDDGEPAHSAGAPILAAIRSARLTNVIVVVVRYFGGTKLGVRGLITAYRNAAEEALSHTRREEIIPKVTFRLRYPYDKTSDLKRILHPYEITRLDAKFMEDCAETLSVKEVDYPGLKEKLTLAGFDPR